VARAQERCKLVCVHLSFMSRASKEFNQNTSNNYTYPLNLPNYPCGHHENVPSLKQHEYIAHGHCALSSWMEETPLIKENGKAIARWLFEDVICHWGALKEIVTDNGGPWNSAVQWLISKYGYGSIIISPYNKISNGKIERPHWDVRQSLYKATGGNASNWFYFFHHVM
jgi:hypothetical protein